MVAEKIDFCHKIALLDGKIDETLLRDPDNLFIESNTVRANFNAIKKMKNQIPKDSAILEDFEKLQSNYNLFEGKINQVCHRLLKRKRKGRRTCT